MKLKSKSKPAGSIGLPAPAPISTSSVAVIDDPAEIEELSEFLELTEADIDDDQADQADQDDRDQETKDAGTEPDPAEDLASGIPSSAPEVTSTSPAPVFRAGDHVMTALGPGSLVAATDVARQAVEQFMADQAEQKLFDVVDSNRVVITLQPDDLSILEAQWRERNSAGIGKIPFSEYLSNRLRACRTHVAARPIFVSDSTRQLIEELFGDVVMGEQDLVNKIDRHIRPIIESEETEDGVLRLNPLDPFILEIVPGWYPDKSPAEAISDFVHDAVREKAGLA